MAVEPGYFAGKPGQYRVQVKLANETWWSPWRFFWIGQPTYDFKKAMQNTAMAAMKKNVMAAKIQGPMGSQGARTAASSTVAAKTMTLK